MATVSHTADGLGTIETNIPVGGAVRGGAARAGVAGRRAGQAVRPHAPRSM